MCDAPARRSSCPLRRRADDLGHGLGKVPPLVLDYLRAVLSGPVVIGAVIAFFLVKFRLPVAALLTRLASAKGPGGFELSFVDQAKAAEDVKRIQEQTQPKEQAVQSVAVWQKAALEMTKLWAFERLFRAIYRSQIMLLRHLANAPNQTARLAELMKYYQEGILEEDVPADKYPYENYMGFLRNAGLVTWSYGGTDDADVKLTTLGQAFLDYLLRMNYNAFERPH
jgi:hypothetical protein